MDLKFYTGHVLLHLVGDTTHLSASTDIKSKDPNVIIEAISCLWIQIYEPPEHFLSDNGGGFANQHFLDKSEAMNISVHTTAAESLFTNFVRMLDKVLEDQNINFQSALAWFTNAKHSLANVHRFSPFQLAIGQNTVLSSMSHDNQKYFTGDSVYFKRVNDWKWGGPRKVLGQDFQ